MSFVEVIELRGVKTMLEDEAPTAICVFRNGTEAVNEASGAHPAGETLAS